MKRLSGKDLPPIIDSEWEMWTSSSEAEAIRLYSKRLLEEYGSRAELGEITDMFERYGSLLGEKKPNLNVVPLESYRTIDRCPPDMISHLEEALKAAKEGRLAELILSYQLIQDGSEFTMGGHGFFHCEGRLDSIHSTCHVLTHYALGDLLGVGEDES